MLAAGEWRATAKSQDPNSIGFHISALYSPIGWKSWEQIARDWLAAQGSEDMLRAARNTLLGETWVESGEAPERQRLAERRQSFGEAQIPEGGLFLGARADVIISITSSFDLILLEAHVSGRTHIACMGTDTKGKQEVEATLLARATFFTDEIAQAITIGEYKHAVADGLLAQDDINELGDVINGAHPGRADASDVTLFDGTGVRIQDPTVASTAVLLAIESGVVIEVDF